MKRVVAWNIFLLSLCFLYSCSSPVSNQHPHFPYDLHLFCKENDAKKVMVCFHGMGGDYRVTDHLEPYLKEDFLLISFNFPDHGLRANTVNFEKIVIGTVQEILPALYVLKNTIVERNLKQISLYGFSAGGAAVINCLAVLNSTLYDKELKEIGIDKKMKKKILKAVQKGEVILDAPLKSVDEIMEKYGTTAAIRNIGDRYKLNQLDPIENLEKLKNLSLNVLLHFQDPDEVLTNRDDEIYAERLKKYNKGSTAVYIGTDGGHSLPHPSLWKYYKEEFKKKR